MTNMAKTTLCIIRHGEVLNPKGIIYGRSVNVRLSPDGYKQMIKLGFALRNAGIYPDIIYSSPLQRTVKSSRALLKVFPNIPLITRTELQDVDQSGIQDKKIEWLETKGTDLYNMPKLKGKIEDQEDLANRIIKVLKEITQKNQGKVIFIVSHGDPIAYAVWRLRFPARAFSSRKELLRAESLGKGEAWIIKIGVNGGITMPKLMKV